MRNRSIAIVYDCLFPFTTGGGERQYRSMAQTMSGKGWSIEYLTSLQWEGPDPDAAGFHVLPVSPRLQLYDAGGVRRASAAVRFAWGVFRSLCRRRRSYTAVLVSGLPILNVFAARAALVGSGTKVIVDYLEIWGRSQWIEYAGGATGRVAWLLQRLAIALTPAATCHSQLSASRLRREGLTGELFISPGLIDSGSAHEFTATASTPPYVLYVGRHIPDKRVDALPGAVAIARREIPELRLIILGGGPSEADTHSAVTAAGGQGWTEFRGFVDQDELDSLMAGATCLVNPSRREGYGLVVVEASAHGTPVVLVADEGNAATELIEPGTNGFIAPSVGAADLADSILRVAQGDAALRSTTRSWYEEALQTRTIERTVERILTYIDTSHAASKPPRLRTKRSKEEHQ